MSAPLDFVSGAPVAHSVCATGEIALRENPAAHRRATAPLPVARQWRSKLGFPFTGDNGEQRTRAS